MKVTGRQAAAVADVAFEAFKDGVLECIDAPSKTDTEWKATFLAATMIRFGVTLDDIERAYAQVKQDMGYGG